MQRKQSAVKTIPSVLVMAWTYLQATVLSNNVYTSEALNIELSRCYGIVESTNSSVWWSRISKLVAPKTG